MSSKNKVYVYKGYFRVDGQTYYTVGNNTAVSHAQAAYYAALTVKDDFEISYYLSYTVFRTENFPSTRWTLRNEYLKKGIRYYLINGNEKILLNSNEVRRIHDRRISNIQKIGMVC